MRLGAQPCQLVVGTKAAQLYGAFRHQRTPSPSLRIQQRLPRTIRKSRLRLQRHHAGRQTGRGHRTAEASVLHRQPVPSGIPQQTAPAASACSKASSPPPTRDSITSRCEVRKSYLNGTKDAVKPSLQSRPVSSRPKYRWGQAHVPAALAPVHLHDDAGVGGWMIERPSRSRKSGPIGRTD